MFPRILLEAGLSVERYVDHFAEHNAPDEEWIAFAARSRWVAVSHDRNIRSDPVAIRTAMESGARLFILRGKHLTGPEKAALFIDALGGIHRVLKEQPSSFIAAVRRLSGQGGILKPDVKVYLAFEEWKRGKMISAEGEDPSDLV
jgi:PIN like domain